MPKRGADHHSAHAVPDEMHGSAFRGDSIAKLGAEDIQASPPIVRMEVGVKAARAQTQLEPQVREGDDVGGADGVLRGAERKFAQPAAHHVPRIQPEKIVAPLHELGAHEPGENEDPRRGPGKRANLAGERAQVVERVRRSIREACARRGRS